jgi:hypothetical protein
MTAACISSGAFLEDFQAGFHGKNFQHRDQVQGREGDCNIGMSREEKM